MSLGSRLAVLGIAVCAGFRAEAQTGRTHVAVFGVSRYSDVRGAASLKYADFDAQDFASLFQKNLGSSRGAPSITLLANEQATAARMTGVLKTVLANASPNDEVLIFVSGRGVKLPDSGAGFVLGYDSRWERGSSTAISINTLAQMFGRSRAGHIYFFADLCRHPPETPDRPNLINLSIREINHPGSKLSALLASRPKQASREMDQWKRGLFCHYLMKALREKAADTDRDGRVSAQELFEYVRDNVRRDSAGAQEPISFGDTKSQPVLSVAVARSLPLLAFMGPLPQGLLAGESEQQQADEAPPEALALEDRGQDVIARYGEGDQFPDDPFRPGKPDFERAANDFGAALNLRPVAAGDPVEEEIRRSLAARMWFCRGRAMIFDGRYADAMTALERAIAIDGSRPEAYNAAGIAQLEQSRFAAASAFFERAIAAAPDWAYARHNLALTHIEEGNSAAAESDYRAAIERTPYHPYLHYNLGLLLQRLNRKREAQAAYEDAVGRFREQIARHEKRAAEWEQAGHKAEAARALDQVRVLRLNEAEAHNALGSLRQARGDRRKAEQEYGASLSLNPKLAAASYNLGLLLMEMAGRNPKKPGYRKAVESWREAAQNDPDFYPAHVELARAYSGESEWPRAEAEFRRAMDLMPASSAARAGLAEVRAEQLVRDGRIAEACKGFAEAAAAAGDPASTRRLEKRRRSVCR